MLDASTPHIVVYGKQKPRVDKTAPWREPRVRRVTLSKSLEAILREWFAIADKNFSSVPHIVVRPTGQPLERPGTGPYVSAAMRNPSSVTDWSFTQNSRENSRKALNLLMKRMFRETAMYRDNLKFSDLLTQTQRRGMPRNMRHTFATKTIEKLSEFAKRSPMALTETELDLVAREMGHANTNTTRENYVHLAGTQGQQSENPLR